MSPLFSSFSQPNAPNPTLFPPERAHLRVYKSGHPARRRHSTPISPSSPPPHSLPSHPFACTTLPPISSLSRRHIQPRRPCRNVRALLADCPREISGRGCETTRTGLRSARYIRFAQPLAQSASPAVLRYFDRNAGGRLDKMDVTLTPAFKILVFSHIKAPMRSSTAWSRKSWQRSLPRLRGHFQTEEEHGVQILTESRSLNGC